MDSNVLDVDLTILKINILRIVIVCPMESLDLLILTSWL